MDFVGEWCLTEHEVHNNNILEHFATSVILHPYVMESSPLTLVNLQLSILRKFLL